MEVVGMSCTNAHNKKTKLKEIDYPALKIKYMHDKWLDLVMLNDSR